MSRDYSSSHMGEGKGRSYDQEFQVSRFLDYLWVREQHLLRSLLRNEGRALGRGLRYLDFACGTGRVLSALEQEASESVGLDISSTMMEEARSKVERSRLVLGDFMEDPSLLEGSFDVVTAFRFFPNADQRLRVAAADYLRTRVTDAGLLIVNNHQNAASLLCRAARLIGKSWPWQPMYNREMIDLLGSAGFTLEGSRGFGFLPGTARRAYLPIAGHAAVDRAARMLRLDPWAQDVVMWFRAGP